MDLATIGLRSDTRGLKKGEVAMDQFARKGERTERRVKKSAVGMSGAMNMVGQSAVRMAAVAGVALGGFLSGKLFLGAIREQEQLQRNMLKTQAIIEATGGAAGRSATQLHEDARALARATLQSTEGIMAAQQVMLTFRHITGETFDRAIEVAADMSEAIGTDLKSSVLQLGKALEDPVTGMTALTRSGTVFTQAQKDMVKEMVAVGDTAGAQAFILGELERQYGGVARAAATGLAGAMDTLGQSFQEFNISMADSMGLGAASTSMALGLASALDFMAQNMDVVVNTGIVAVAVLGKMALGALGFAGALGVLRFAVMATGIGALVIGAGVLLTWFMKLVRGAGGFGAAMGLLGDVAAAVWDDMGAAAWGLHLKVAVVGNQIKFSWTRLMSELAMVWSNFIGVVAADFEKLPFTSGLTEGLRDAQAAARNSSLDYRDSLSQLDDQLVEINRQQGELAARTSTSTAAIAALVDVVMSEGAESDGAAAATADLVAALENVPDAASAAGAAAGGAGDAVETLADKMENLGKGALSSLGQAFDDFTSRGFKDFKGFVSDVWGLFKNLFFQMIGLAAKNKIMISLGLGGSGLAGAASGGGGLLGGLLGGFGTAAGGGATGLLGGLGSTLGVGAATGASTGLFGIGAGAAAAGGGALATIGAALPIIGIGLALFAIFKKKKPPISKKDFAAIQTGLELTGMQLFSTGRAGQKMAADLKKSFNSIEDFTKATESYYNNFFTAEEKRQKAIEGIGGVFSELGLAVPATATVFRDMVEAQDLTTKAGRDTYASLLQVSDAFAQVYGGVNNVTQALTALNASVGGSIFATLVDERRAAAYQRNGIAFDIASPDRAGGGVAYRGTGPRVSTRVPTEAERLALEAAEEAKTQTTLMLNMLKDGKRRLRIEEDWNIRGMPPERDA